MKPVTIITSGETRIYANAREAAAALLASLPNEELSPLCWLEVIRAELRRRTVVKVFEWEPPTNRAASTVKPVGSASSA